jgi:hypothetical protein
MRQFVKEAAMTQKAFFAYPAKPISIVTAITDSVGQLNDQGSFTVTPWESIPIVGLKLDHLIRQRLQEVDSLIADITFPNFNVYYEIGYCYGARKPVILTVNRSYSASHANVSLTGLFDTIGQLRYENANDLSEQLIKRQVDNHISSLFQPKDHSQPLFLLDTLRKIDFRNWIVQSITNMHVNVRRFDPDETPRLTLHTSIAAISSSTGVIIPLLAEAIDDSLRHNLRASFLAGLAHGCGLEPLITQYEDLPAPVDFRDFIDTSRTRHEVTQVVEEYCADVLIKNQDRGTFQTTGTRSLLESIDLARIIQPIDPLVAQTGVLA